MAFAIWNPATSYVPDDIVNQDGLLYIATLLQPNVNQLPVAGGTTYWGLVGGTNPSPVPGVQSVAAAPGGGIAVTGTAENVLLAVTGVQTVTANGPAAGVITSGDATDVTLGVYQWPNLQLSSIANSVALATLPVVGPTQTGAILGIDSLSPPVLLFTSTFPPSLAGGGNGYTNAIFQVSFLPSIQLYVTSGAALTYNIQVFPRTISSPPAAGSSNSYSLCSAPISFNTITTNGAGSYLLPRMPFTVSLNNNGTAFQTVYWYAVNTTPGQVTAYFLSDAAAVPNIQWSGFGWNGPNTVAG